MAPTMTRHWIALIVGSLRKGSMKRKVAQSICARHRLLWRKLVRRQVIRVSKQVGCLVLCVFMSSALTAPVEATELSDDNAKEQNLVQDIKAREDPTILNDRAWIEAEWKDDRHDENSLEIILGGRKAWRISDRQDWAVQLELPYKRISAGEADGNFVSQGIADIRVTVGTAIRLSETWRVGGALELLMPTGDVDVSDNIWRLQERVTVAWDATPWLTFSPQVKYFHTIAKDHGAESEHYLELFFPVTVLLPDNWSVAPRYESKVDFVDDYVTNSGKLSVGKQLEHPALSLELSLKVPFNSQSSEYQLNFAVTKSF